MVLVRAWLMVIRSASCNDTRLGNLELQVEQETLWLDPLSQLDVCCSGMRQKLSSVLELATNHAPSLGYAIVEKCNRDL